MPLAIVLSFDHLRAGHLGCYGNDWVETPNFDRLATQAVVFDRHFAQDVDAAATLRAWWGGEEGTEGHKTEGPFLAARRVAPDSFLSRLPPDVRTWLFVESDGTDSHFVAPPFQEIVSARGVDSLERSEEETPYAQLVRKLIDRLPEVAPHGSALVWIKARGVPTPWLPPRGFADLYLDEFGLSGKASDEEDEEQDTSEAAIEQKYARALYAAYVSWLDRWTGKLLRTLETQPGWDDTLLIVTAAAGQNLGEHGPIGESSLPLREALLHTPLIVRHPDRSHDATRRGALVVPADIPATLLDWFGVASAVTGRVSRPSNGQSLLPIVCEEVDTLRDTICCSSVDEQGLRNDDYFYVEPKGISSESDPGAALLFEKPADRWDQADLAPQYPDITEALRGKLHGLVESSGTLPHG